MDWTARTICTADPPTDDELEHIAITLDATVIYRRDTGHLEALFSVQADTMRQASDRALGAAANVLPTPPTQLSVETTDDYLAGLAHPTPVDLAGASEAAELLGISRVHLGRLAERPDFPRPLARLRSGPVWTRTSLTTYHDTAPRRRPGRPPRAVGSTPP